MARPIPRLSILAPCFDEERCLAEFYARVTAAAHAAVGTDYEMVLVNDGSCDSTLNIMHALADDDPRLIAVNLSRNHGHQLALTAGLTLCRAERVLIIDADLQDPPELLGRMMEEMDHGADVVFGQRRRRSGETPFKNASAALFYRALRRLVDIDIPADAGDFRLISRRAIDILNGMPERFRFIRGMVSWIGLRQVPIVYDRDPRYAGTTGYSATKMIRFALDAITSFSIVPLRLASICGCITALCGVLMLGYTVGSWLFNVVVPGWTSLTTMYRFNAFARGLTRACVKKPVYRLPSNASQPTTEEIGPLASRWLDPLLGYRCGKSALAIWQKTTA